jgi:hypothetical protein
MCVRSLLARSAILALGLAGSSVLAQPAAPALADVPPPPRLVPGAAVPAAPAPSASAATPAAVRAPARAASAVPSNTRVIEDDEVRIEESRGQRGQLQRITVRNKNGTTRSYEIIVGPAGQDPSQARGATGQRAWSLFDF